MTRDETREWDEGNGSHQSQGWWLDGVSSLRAASTLTSMGCSAAGGARGMCSHQWMDSWVGST